MRNFLFAKRERGKRTKLVKLRPFESFPFIMKTFDIYYRDATNPALLFYSR